jgi:hypothetical protein
MAAAAKNNRKNTPAASQNPAARGSDPGRSDPRRTIALAALAARRRSGSA